MNTIPKGLVRKPRDKRDYVRGISSPIPYVVRNASGDWRPYLPTYEPQKYGEFETNDCWALAGINDIATQCNFLKAEGQFPAESLAWFQSNGYIDPAGSFAFSERFPEILSGARDNGNDQIELWRISQDKGLLPRKDLMYTDTQSYQFNTQEGFAADYFNPAAITPAMTAKAFESKKYIALAYEWIGEESVMPSVTEMEACLKHSPIQIGIPVCMNTWNSGTVTYCGGRDAEHSVLMDNIEQSGLYDFRDQYHPENKTLSADYYIPMATHGVVTPVLTAPYVPPATAIPYPEKQNVWVKVWSAVWEWFNQKKLEGVKTNGVPRSPKWSKVRNDFLKGKSCAVCGTDKSLNAHHLVAFHTDMAKELDPNNLIALCEGMDKDCHRLVGHLGNYQSINENCIEDAKMLNVKVVNRPKWDGSRWIYST